MEAEVTLKIPQSLYTRAQQLAQARQQPIADVLTAAIDLVEAQQTEANEDEQRIAREERAYEAMRDELISQYAGQYVAIYNGLLIDHDPSEIALLQRLNQDYPHQIVLMRKVQPLPEPVLRFRSPRFVTSAS